MVPRSLALKLDDHFLLPFSSFIVRSQKSDLNADDGIVQPRPNLRTFEDHSDVWFRVDMVGVWVERRGRGGGDESEEGGSGEWFG